MLIYSNHVELNYQLLVVTLVLLLFGILFFFLFGKTPIVTNEDFSTRFFGLNRFDLTEQSKKSVKIFKMMGLMFLIASSYMLVTMLGKHFYQNNIEYFQNVESISGRIDDLYVYQQFASGLASVTVNNNEFSLLQSKYISNRRLSVGDSVQIEYYVNRANVKEIISIRIMK